MSARRAAIGVLPVAALAACSARPPSVDPLVWYGDVLVERYPGSDGIEQGKWQRRCDDAGGQLRWTVRFDSHGEFVCWDEDY